MNLNPTVCRPSCHPLLYVIQYHIMYYTVLCHMCYVIAHHTMSYHILICTCVYKYIHTHMVFAKEAAKREPRTVVFPGDDSGL